MYLEEPPFNKGAKHEIPHAIAQRFQEIISELLVFYNESVFPDAFRSRLLEAIPQILADIAETPMNKTEVLRNHGLRRVRWQSGLLEEPSENAVFVALAILASRMEHFRESQLIAKRAFIETGTVIIDELSARSRELEVENLGIESRGGSRKQSTLARKSDLQRMIEETDREIVKIKRDIGKWKRHIRTLEGLQLSKHLYVNGSFAQQLQNYIEIFRRAFQDSPNQDVQDILSEFLETETDEALSPQPARRIAHHTRSKLHRILALAGASVVLFLNHGSSIEEAGLDEERPPAVEPDDSRYIPHIPYAEKIPVVNDLLLEEPLRFSANVTSAGGTQKINIRIAPHSKLSRLPFVMGVNVMLGNTGFAPSDSGEIVLPVGFFKELIKSGSGRPLGQIFIGDKGKSDTQIFLTRAVEFTMTPEVLNLLQ